MSSENVLVSILFSHIQEIHRMYKDDRYFKCHGQYSLIELLGKELDKLAIKNKLHKYERAANLCLCYPAYNICEMCLAKVLETFDENFITEFSKLFLTSKKCQCSVISHSLVLSQDSSSESEDISDSEKMYN